MSDELEVDYLVVGAGAAGMAFTDELLAHSDATIAIVDRRHAPGGHWLDAYPFVRLHQPSAFYGVGSVALGEDAIDATGPNAGFYELAGPDEIRAYYERVMHRRFLPTGRVRYFPNCEYQGGTRFTWRLTGAERRVRVRRKVVDARYIEGAVPATSPPPFEVAPGVRCVPVGQLASFGERVERYVIVGGGKTAADACVWLLEQGVPPAAIRWVKPRESWWLNRKFQQPHTLVAELYRGIAIQLEAMARAASVTELFALLEAEEVFLRIDRSVAPTMLRGAILSEGEVRQLRRIEDVVRLGHVRRIEPDAIILDEGQVPTDAGTVHVHCAARALARPPLRPIFEERRVTLQGIGWGFACYQAAVQGVVEAMIADDDEKNRLCAPILYWDDNEDYVRAFLATMVGEQDRATNAQLRAWMRTTRLSPTSAINARQGDTRVEETRERIKRSGVAAAMNLQQMLAEPIAKQE
jgi:putative NAD(P)-binding protein